MTLEMTFTLLNQISKEYSELLMLHHPVADTYKGYRSQLQCVSKAETRLRIPDRPGQT